MNKAKKPYEPPRLKIYQFDDNDQILTESGGIGGGGTTPDPVPDPTAEYAANALNKFMGGSNTTIE